MIVCVFLFLSFPFLLIFSLFFLICTMLDIFLISFSFSVVFGIMISEY